MPSIEQLYHLSIKDSLTVAGAISGTSADGIDVALVEFRGAVDQLDAVTVLASGTYAYRDETKKLVSAAPNLNAEQVSVLETLVAQDFARAIKQLMTENNVACDLVASHGQTVFHHSSGVSALSAQHPSTLQVGNGGILSEQLGLPVIYDFRSKDIAAGGQGAPLTPATDFYLYRMMHTPQGKKVDGILNLGGIGNLTVFGDTIETCLGFDTGPANAPIDRLVRIFTQGKKQFDDNGAIAASGVVNQTFLQELLAKDAYVKKPAPKSTGFEAYGDVFVEQVCTLYKKPIDADLIATISAYVAQTVAWAAIKLLKKPLTTLVVAGGGAKNDFIMAQLKMLLPGTEIITSDQVGISADFREAIAFALLGYARIKGFAINLAGITGAKHASVLGSIAL